MKNSKPLVYSCSGCSNLAQLANSIALKLDEEKFARMSCIAGVGGGVEPLVKLAQSGKGIIAIDGCELHCVRFCLNKVEVEPDLHLTLTKSGLRKARYQKNSEQTVDHYCNSVRDLWQYHKKGGEPVVTETPPQGD